MLAVVVVILDEMGAIGQRVDPQSLLLTPPLGTPRCMHKQLRLYQ